MTKTSKKQSATKTVTMSDKAIKRMKLPWHKAIRTHVFIMCEGTKAIIVSGEPAFALVVEYAYNKDIARANIVGDDKIDRTNSGEICCVFSKVSAKFVAR